MAIGVVDYAYANEVLPWFLAQSFQRSDFLVPGSFVMNEYNGGESQRRVLVTNIRRAWTATFRLTSANLATLRAFYEARSGPIEPFYFYDVTETVDFAYDDTGELATGRYTVRFDCDWERSIGVGSLRGTVTLRLLELAGPPE